MSDKYRVDVFTASGLMIQLLEEFEQLCDANNRASVIALQGLRVCLTPECMTFVPAHMITSVSIYHPTKTFEVSAAVVEIDREMKAHDNSDRTFEAGTPTASS